MYVLYSILSTVFVSLSFFPRLFCLFAKVGRGFLGVYGFEYFWLAILFVMSLVGAGVVTVSLEATSFMLPFKNEALARIFQSPMVSLRESLSHPRSYQSIFVDLLGLDCIPHSHYPHEHASQPL